MMIKKAARNVLINVYNAKVEQIVLLVRQTTFLKMVHAKVAEN